MGFTFQTLTGLLCCTHTTDNTKHHGQKDVLNHSKPQVSANRRCD